MIQWHKDKIHKDVCNNQVIKKYLEKNHKIFSEKDIDNIVNECNGSIHEILKVVKILRSKENIWKKCLGFQYYKNYIR